MNALRESACLALALALSLGFLFWVIASTPQQLGEYPLVLPRYLVSLALGIVPALALTAVARALQRMPLLARAVTGSCLVYLAALKVLGLALAPWLALVVALAAIAVVRPGARAAAPLLVLSAMGTLAGLCFTLTAQRYLAVFGP